MRRCIIIPIIIILRTIIPISSSCSYIFICSFLVWNYPCICIFDQSHEQSSSSPKFRGVTRIESQIMSGLPHNFRSELPWLRNQVSTMRQAMDSMLRRLSRLTAESQAGYTLRAALRVAAMPRFRNFASFPTRRLTPIGRQQISKHIPSYDRHPLYRNWMDGCMGWMDG